MKKLIYSAWILSFASTGCLTLATAWKSGNFNDKTKIPATNIGPVNPWNAIDLRNFVVPNHNLNIQNQQATNINEADLNINFTTKDTSYNLINYLLQAIDNKYGNFNHHYLLDNQYFEDKLSFKDYKDTFNIINTDKGESWDTDQALKIPLGSFYSYNLALKNLQTNTSFNFSLNLTHFDLNLQSINFTSFGALPYIHHEYSLYSGNTVHYVDTNTLTANMNKYVNVKNPDYAGQTDSFFLNPISYSYHSSIWEDDDAGGYHPNPSVDPKGEWNYGDFQSLSNFTDPDQDVIGTDLWPLGRYIDTDDGSTNDGQSMTVEMFTDYWRISNTNTFMFKGVGASISTMDDYPHGAGPWSIIPSYEYNSLTTSYKTKLFKNSAYPLDEQGFDAGQNVLNRLEDLSKLPITENDIKNPFVQAQLKTKLKGDNPNVLTDLQWYDISFSLASGSTTLVYGDNSAYVNLNWYGESVQTPIIINYKPVGYESAQNIANKLQGKTIVLDPKFWVGKDIKKYKEQLDNAIVSQGILTKDEVQYVSWGDLTLNKAKSYPNCDFTVSKNGETAVAHNITLDVQYTDKQTFNKVNSLLQEGLMNDEGGALKYNGPTIGTTAKSHIDTSDPKAMQDLINSVGEDPAIMHYDPNFNAEYGEYISFNKQIINENNTVTMHVKVGGYTKDYQIQVWWQSMS